MKSIQQIIDDLSRPIAREDLKTKEVNNRKSGTTTELTYIPWYRAIRYLDEHAPGWSYEVRSITPIPGAVSLTVRISIPCAEGVVYREATGIEDEETSSFGDPTSNAESMALRRAAAKFGLGLYLYDKGNGSVASGGGGPRPKMLGDIVTPKQLWMIRNLARELGIDPDAECQSQLRCPLEEISKKAASGLIEYLTAKAKAAEPERPVKLEGAQPKAENGKPPTLKGSAGQVTAFAAGALKWDAAQLAAHIEETFHSVVMQGKLAEVLEFMSADEHRELMRTMRAKLGGGK